MLLTDKFVERARAHAIGKRAGAIVWIFSARDGLKEAHKNHFTTEAQRHSLRSEQFWDRCFSSFSLCLRASMVKIFIVFALTFRIAQCWLRFLRSAIPL